MLIMNNLMWFWLFVMLICVFVEAFTFSLTTIWGALSALIMIFLSKTNMPFKWQIIVFLVITILLVLTTRPLAVKKFKLGKEKLNFTSLEGQEVFVTKKITKFEKGQVKAKNGVIWTAESSEESDIEEGSVCVIEAVSGNTLSVRRK